MTLFLDHARSALTLPYKDASDLLLREQYITRLLYREGEDAREAYQLNYFLDEHNSHQSNILKIPTFY